MQRLPAPARRRVKENPLLRREVDDKLVPAAWRKAVFANAALPQGSVPRDTYVVCVLEQLYRALQRRDVFASPSHRIQPQGPASSPGPEKDLTTSVVALLVSEACNIGMTPVTNPAHDALTRSRLVHVDQFYLRADTIAAANAMLIEAQSEAPIVAYWGEGLLARSTGCASWSRCGPSARPRRRSTSGSSAASPGSTPSTTRSRHRTDGRPGHAA